VVLAVALLPAVALVLIASFTISTYNRTAREGGGISLDVGRAVGSAAEASSDLTAGPGLDLLLPPIFSRAGFFDYSAEIIAHRAEYASVFNMWSYAKSIVDNVLTPGFDVYDQPKAANALVFIYLDSGSPAKSRVEESYQSDQFGIYGEFYALFGYASLPLLFFVAYLLKRIYVRVRSANPFVFVMKRIVVLTIFVKTLDSFGFDWTIVETLPLVASIFMYAFVFSIKRRRVAANEQGAEIPVAFVNPVR
jgi:hypothetical protein